MFASRPAGCELPAPPVGPHLASPRSHTPPHTHTPRAHPQVYVSQAVQLVARTDRRSVDECVVLEVLLRFAQTAAKGWLEHKSAQCLVRAGAAHVFVFVLGWGRAWGGVRAGGYVGGCRSSWHARPPAHLRLTAALVGLQPSAVPSRCTAALRWTRPPPSSCHALPHPGPHYATCL